MTREERKIQREIDFTDWWLREHKMEGIPTYADAIEWADEHPCMSEEEQVGMGGLGMIWQKKHLINKACEWLKDELYDIEDNTQRGGVDIRSKCYFTSGDLIEHFRKAMQNE